MGTYLSTPVLDKHTETGAELGDSDTPVRWAMVDMQGWRKSMEDAHVARTDVPLPRRDDGGGDGGGGRGGMAMGGEEAVAPPTHAKVFAVFDGHGGAEVARFCSIHLVPTLTSRSDWRGADDDNNHGGVGSEAKSVASCVGHALIDSFHALDRLIDDPNWRLEIERWRTARPPPYVSAGVDDQDDSTMGPPKSDKNFALEEVDVDVNVVAIAEDAAIAQDASKLLEMMDGGGGDAQGSPGADDELATTNAEVIRSSVGGDGKKGEATGTEEDYGGMNAGSFTNLSSTLVEDSDDEDEVFEDSLSEHAADASGLDNKESDGVVRDDSDDEKEELANDNEDVDGEVDGTSAPSTTVGGSKGTMVLSANDAVALFQKLLRMNGTDEGDDGDDDDDDEDVVINGGILNGGSGSPKGTVNLGDEGDEVIIPTKAQLLNPPTGIVAQSASVPTRIQNGRKICNLPDHPVHAGCTSIVAVIVGRTLVVANAGDSRAVICRAGGLTEPLSFDHKPLQTREMNRITNAGGFVNQFGRVNGNLNLSRSIGDLKYKQVPGIPPAEQMITAEPDIISTSLGAGDEFIVLGCDGIWDCLSNEECVKYVRDRINSKHPREIGKEMLDEIVSSDPRASQGIGGDNMTIIIVDLLPNSRPYGNNC